MVESTTIIRAVMPATLMEFHSQVSTGNGGGVMLPSALVMDIPSASFQ